MPRYRPVTIRMAPSTWAAVKAAADDEGVSVADFVRGSVSFVLGVRTGMKLAAPPQDVRATVGLVLAVLGLDWEAFEGAADT